MLPVVSKYQVPLCGDLLYFLIPRAGNLISNIYPRDGNLSGFFRKNQIPGGLPALPTVPEIIDRCIIFLCILVLTQVDL